MKQAILFTAFIAVFHAGHACAYPATHKRFPKGIYNDTTSAGMAATTQILSAIINVVGLQPNFELKQAKVLNIEASVSHRKRYILYNPDFITRINNVTKDKWAAIALVAHEVGHHLNGHTIRKGGSTPQLELEADEFAGFVLRKLGASLKQAQEVMKYIAGTQTSKTHPGRSSRMLAIQQGWDKAADIRGTDAVAKNIPSAVTDNADN
ncbi:MAG: hypothetical protein WDO16_18565 [Bacteroidota bacterium]